MICPNCAYGDYTLNKKGEQYLKNCPRCGYVEPKQREG